MDRKDAALATLRQARSSVAGLARESLDSQAFEEAAWCARLAGELDRLIGGPTPAGQADIPARVAGHAANVGDGGTGKSRRRGLELRRAKPDRVPASHPGRKNLAKQYPTFYRDDDSLVKVGWSKSQDGEYEHRAPKRAVEALLRAVADAGAGELFGMDSLLPLRGDGGEDLPSYQAYLALAWLRSAGIAERRGQEGYRIDSAALDDARLQKLWDGLPTRRP